MTPVNHPLWGFPSGNLIPTRSPPIAQATSSPFGPFGPFSPARAGGGKGGPALSICLATPPPLNPFPLNPSPSFLWKAKNTVPQGFWDASSKACPRSALISELETFSDLSWALRQCLQAHDSTPERREACCDNSKMCCLCRARFCPLCAAVSAIGLADLPLSHSWLRVVPRSSPLRVCALRSSG